MRFLFACVSSSCTWKKKMIRLLEICINGEDSDLSLHNDLVWCTFPGDIHCWHSPPSTTSFIFSWEWYLGWGLWPLWPSTQFFWVSPMNTGYYTFVFPVHLSHFNLIIRLRKEPRRVEENFFLPNNSSSTNFIYLKAVPVFLAFF